MKWTLIFTAITQAWISRKFMATEVSKLDLSFPLLTKMKIAQSLQTAFRETLIATVIQVQVQCLGMISKAFSPDTSNTSNFSNISSNRSRSQKIRAINNVINNRDLTVLIIMPKVKYLQICSRMSRETIRYTQLILWVKTQPLYPKEVIRSLKVEYLRKTQPIIITISML